MNKGFVDMGVWGSFEAHCWSCSLHYQDYIQFWEGNSPPSYRPLSEGAFELLYQALDADLTHYMTVENGED